MRKSFGCALLVAVVAAEKIDRNALHKKMFETQKKCTAEARTVLSKMKEKVAEAEKNL